MWTEYVSLRLTRTHLVLAAAAAGVTVCYVRSRTFDDVKREWRVGGRDAEGFLLAERTFCADKGQNEDKSEDIGILTRFADVRTTEAEVFQYTVSGW